MGDTKDKGGSLREVPENAAPQQEVAVAESVALAPDNPELQLSAEYLNEVNAEILTQLKSLDVNELTNARSLIGQSLRVSDAFLHPFTENGQTVEKMIIEATDESGIMHHILQNPTGSRMNVLSLFNNVRRLGRSLELTNCEFREVGAPKMGNRFIALQTTPKTDKIVDGAAMSRSLNA